MNYIIPAISTVILIISIKKKYTYLTLLALGLNVTIWPNIPHTFEDFIYISLITLIATILGYNISKYL